MSTKKKRKGRPLSSPMPRDNLIGVRLNDKEVECLSSYAWRYDISLSEVIRQALEILSVIPENYVRSSK